MAYIKGHFEIRADKTIIFRGLPGKSYLNTSRRGMSICNLALCNHSVCIDQKPLQRFLDILHGCGSINYVHDTMGKYDIELQLSLDFKRKNHLRNDGSSDNSVDLEDNKEKELVESEKIQINQK